VHRSGFKSLKSFFGQSSFVSAIGSVPSALLAAGVLAIWGASPAVGQIYDYETDQVIPGTQGITLGPGVDLSNWNSAGHELEYANLGSYEVSIDLSGASFANSDLTAAFLHGANLTNVDFTNANLSSASLGSTNVSGANFAGATVTSTDLESSGLTLGQLYSTASFQAGNLQGVGLGGLDLTGGNFANLNLGAASFGGATLTNASFANANLANAGLEGAVLTNANFTGAAVTGADFGQSSLTSLSANQLYSTASALSRNGFRVNRRGFALIWKSDNALAMRVAILVP
jgi:uncharacterized protein YjbI with pentapeptide repeats